MNMYSKAAEQSEYPKPVPQGHQSTATQKLLPKALTVNRPPFNMLVLRSFVCLDQ